MLYDFDTTPNRRGTGSMKWDVAEHELPMWVADMDFATAPQVIRAIKNRASHGVFGYSIVPDEWYDAIISWWKRRHNYTIDKSWLQFCTGAVPAISCLVQRITNVGDNVAVLTPVYDIFFHSIENFGRHVAECGLAYSNGNYQIDFDALERVLSNPLTTMLILCNPHNPTGTVWTHEQLSKIGKLCKKYGVVVLSDEIHCDLTLPNVSYTPFASVSEDCAQNSITCISASKAFNLAGLQSAAVFVPNKRLREIAIRGLNSMEVAEPNSFAVGATVAAFNQSEEWLDSLRGYLADNRNAAAEYLKKNAPSAHLIDGKATYLLWIDCSAITNDSNELCDFIAERYGLILSSGAQYRGNGKTFVRMNIACDRARMTDGLHRLSDGLKAYTDKGTTIE
ncbi:MAG: pyridoxal phosphate-dependent aminotransferase [Clostridiales bacterium]|nr:pyridoxal phosphate-dependent aminotransferase [Clostridiales bacterium]